MNKSYKLMQAALIEAKKGELTHVHGCLAIDYRTGEIVAKSYNIFRRRHKNSGSHAETSTFYKVPHKFRSRIFLFVVRRGKDGTPRLSKPCEKCQKVINRYNIDVYYSLDNGKIEKL